MMRQSWSDVPREPMSEDAIRRLHSPAEKYRISPNKYEVGVNASADVSVGFMIYVLSGKCKYVSHSKDEESNNSELVLTAGDVGNIPPGRYTFQSLGDTLTQVVRVFKLPSYRPLHK